MSTPKTGKTSNKKRPKKVKERIVLDVEKVLSKEEIDNICNKAVNRTVVDLLEGRVPYLTTKQAVDDGLYDKLDSPTSTLVYTLGVVVWVTIAVVTYIVLKGAGI